MDDDIIVERLELSNSDKVLDFLKAAYADNPRHSDAAFWSWHFVQTPYASRDDLSVWIARCGETIAGHLGATPIEFNVNGRAVRAIWILDLIVDPSFRRRGIAKKLALASRDYCPYVLGINTSRQHSSELLEGLGWKIFSGIPRFQKILYPGEALKLKGLMRDAANLAAAPIRRGFKRRPDQNVRPVESFGDAFDNLWSEARTQWRCSVTRNSAMLNWQFSQQPGKRFEVLGYFDQDELLGYVVIFIRGSDARNAVTKAAISDICYHPRDPRRTVNALVSAALRMCSERKVGSLVTDVIDPLVEKCLRELGFWHVKSILQLLAYVPAEDRDVVYDATNWYLTRADSDISIFEGPNL